MGGDGGVIASSRRYMRGAGTANHTADNTSHTKKETDKEVMKEIMTLCYLTKVPLQFSKQQIVVDPYGRLYHKEQAIEALLRRMENGNDELGSHIRGMKDLKTVKFQFQDGDTKPICPVTNVELNGWNTAYLLPNSKNENFNVISERAISEMGPETLRSEYGDDILEVDKLTRLAPPPSKMEEIQERVKLQQEQEKISKQKKSNKKKRKHTKQIVDTSNKTIRKDSEMTQGVRRRVQSSVQSSNVLSTLFVKDKDKHSKKNTDYLFIRS